VRSDCLRAAGAGVRAPMITEVTSLRPKIHASVTWAGVEASSVAIFCNSIIIGAVFIGSIGGKFRRVRRPVAASLFCTVYLPLRYPPARGLQTNRATSLLQPRKRFRVRYTGSSVNNEPGCLPRWPNVCVSLSPVHARGRPH
jgi:hypothetical protein